MYITNTDVVPISSFQKAPPPVTFRRRRITNDSCGAPRTNMVTVTTRIVGATVWLHQQDTSQTRKVHSSKVRLADTTLAWDEITARPRRKQTPKSVYTIE